MTPERWQQIDELFHAALACEASERAQFLAEQCADDTSLRREVESLLSSLEEANDFIETPAGDVAAELLGTHESAFQPGQQIENYRIVRQLGAGGMGEVYLAEDIRLKRKVALKLLPPHFTVNPDRVRRFEREARAASALNHPNIVTIYEIGHSNTTHFIANEFVDGKTLRQLINEKPFTLNEMLNVSIQVADALSGAHAAGIVHRDIKPENIMIRRDGYVKILDFGLAKLTERQIIDSDLETPTLLQSNPGLVMGTVQYMSPEQARAKHVGVGTDIWSLGIVMYELLAGHVPFTGETPSHVMVSLMEHPLPPLIGCADVPPELDRIVTKALRKRPKERYQTVTRLGLDLKHLKQELQLEASLKASLGAVPSRKQSTSTHEDWPSVAPTQEIGAAHATSGTYAAVKVTNSKRTGVLVLAGLIITVGVTFGLSKLLRQNWSSHDPKTPFKTRELLRLTSTGTFNDAAISPDGKYVAYAAENAGKESIRLRQAAMPNDIELVAPADCRYFGETFSLDGKFLYYNSRERNNTIATLHRVSLERGVSEQVIVDVDGPITLSPDGNQLAFVRGSSSGERALMLANIDGLEERKLASRIGYQAFFFNGPAWSPDGKSIAVGAAYDDDVNGRYLNVVSVDVADGSLRPLSTEKWKAIGRIAWLQDGRGLLFTATEFAAGSTSQLWFLSLPGGQAERITADLQDYHGVSVTNDATTLISKQTETISSLWVAPDNDVNRARQILSQKEDNASQATYYFRTRFSWMPDGQILYTSLVKGVSSIWMTAQGGGNIQLAGNSNDLGFPSITPDGRYIIFTSEHAGVVNVWRMDRDGSNKKQLTMGEDESWAWCSPDSQWVVYHSGKQGRRTLWRVSVDGGQREQLTDYTSVCPVVSPDGKWISFYYRSAIKAPWQIAIMPFSGGRPVKTFEVPLGVALQSLVRWTPDGLSLAYIMNRDGISNIWSQPVAGGSPQQLTDFKSDQMFWFDWSADGQQLGVSRGTVTSDIVMIRDLAGR